ncbi:CRISPR system precrRNA processing endoribonuclease RAMP protein Cas6 [Oryzomonas rubra]|uniref:CRISPR system precrRNA processing endoribonuclease RAMP protein Cas6 n=1 Tax=Oryzomonas rubra TaxID=2509454 RepID=A0A5A9XPM4_9BACT|nr:CRISPR system precrRNA processing endoribonuclease RAMP protein Cas6 [Oryzomonas rubra]KAA0895036.1 CRISPR system precrRNA processing endoribonuclease RAMP protein Cas6 [Oryzomonas rubra]
MPFIFSFPPHGAAPRQADDFACTLVLVGKALNHTTEFISAFRSLLANGHNAGHFAAAAISRVESLDFHGNPAVIATGDGAPDLGNLVTLDAHGIVDSRCRPTDAVGVAFITPLKLAKTGKVMNSFDAGQFVRSLMRRVSALAYYYCGYEMRDNFREYAHVANRIELLEDNFFYADAGRRSMALSGVMGDGVLNGDFNDLMPFLALGEYLHLGKGASYGMGHYRLAW